MNNPEYQDDRKLQREYQRVFISKAIREIRDEEIRFLAADSPENQHDLEFLAKHREKRLKKLMRALRWAELKNGFFTVAPRTARFAVTALGILCIGLTTAFASNGTFRVRFFSMFAQDYGQYTAIGLREDEQKSFDVPAEWGGMYYPAYVPDEFEVLNIENLAGQLFLISFVNENNEYMLFKEMTEDGELNIDTENARVYYTDIRGNTALISVKTDLTIAVWNEQNRIIIIIVEGEREEEILKIARSVTRIK